MEKSSQIIVVTFILGLAVALQSLWMEEPPTPPEITVYWGIMPKPSPGMKGAWIYVFNLGGETVDYVHVEMNTESPTIIWRCCNASSREPLETRIEAMSMRGESTKELMSQRIFYNITDLRPGEQYRFYVHFLTEGRYTQLAGYIMDWRDREVDIETVEISVESSCERQGGCPGTRWPVY